MSTETHEFSIDTPTDKLVGTFQSWLKLAKPYHEELLKSQKKALSYYLGDQTNLDLIPDHDSRSVENRIFEAVETIVPIVTSRAHHFLVMPGSESERSLEKANSLQKVLTRKYETLLMQEKLEMATRHLLLMRFACLKWHWDILKDDVGVSVIDPRLIYVPELRVTPDEIPYVIEYQEYSPEEFLEYFPGVSLENVEISRSRSEEPSSTFSGSVVKAYEVWTPEMVAWFSGNRVVDKKANPYWDFTGEEVETTTKRGRKKKELRFYNHLDRPTMPYVFLSTFDVGDGPFGNVALADVAIPLQDDINTQRRLIIDNMNRLGNGQVLVDSDTMSKEEAEEQITSEPGAIIYGKNVASLQKVRREPGVPLPASHFTHLSQTEAVFDNIMGVHGATRGAATSPTLGQELISRQQDFTRIDLITRVLNRGVAKVANGLVQLMRLFYDAPHVVKILGEDGAIEFVRMTRDDIEDFVEVDVKSGEILPMDRVALRTEAVQLWQLGALDPVTLFERLEFPDPEKAAERLLAWKTGQLTQETMAKIQEIRASAAVGRGAGRGGSEPSPAAREVETPLSVLQRAQAGLGGTAPITGTPNQ